MKYLSLIPWVVDFTGSPREIIKQELQNCDSSSIHRLERIIKILKSRFIARISLRLRDIYLVEKW